MVRIFVEAAGAAEQYHVALFGPNLAEWPIWAYVAMKTINSERARADDALFRANTRREDAEAD